MSINPSPAEEGEEITFTASAQDSSGGSIVAYEWASDTNGTLYEGSGTSFKSRHLTPGNHVISLRAQNNNQEWSNFVTADLTINPDATAPSIDVVYSEVGSDDDDDYPEGSTILLTLMEEFGEDGLEGHVTIKDHLGDPVVDEAPLADAEGGDYTYLWDSADAVPGEYSVDMALWDLADNVDDRFAVDLVVTLRDMTPPKVNEVYSLVGPDGDGTYPMDSMVSITVVDQTREKGLIGTITINSTDPETGAEDDTLVNSDPLVDAGTGSYTYVWDTYALPKGEYHVETTLMDIYGNKDGNGLAASPDLIIILEDITAPVIEEIKAEVGNDKDGEYLLGSKVKITVIEDNKETDLTGDITITTDDGEDPRIEGEPLNEGKKGTYTFEWKTGRLEPGDYDIYVTLTDDSGNVDDDGADGVPFITVTLDHEREPPTVFSTLPYLGMTDVTVDAVVAIQFDEDLDTSTLVDSSFKFEDAEGKPVKFNVDYDNETVTYPTVTLTPKDKLAPLMTYTITVSKYVTDQVGNELVDPYEFYFTTEFGDDPVITYFFPRESVAEINETHNKQDFNVSYKPDTDDVTIEWYKNGSKLKGGRAKYTFTKAPEDAGQTYEIKVRVIRGEGDTAVYTEHAWTVEVAGTEGSDGGDGGGGDGGDGDDGVTGSLAGGNAGDLCLMYIILIIVVVVVLLVVVIMVVRSRKKKKEEEEQEAARLRAEEQARLKAQQEMAYAQSAPPAGGGYSTGYESQQAPAAPEPTTYGSDYGGGGYDAYAQQPDVPEPTPVGAADTSGSDQQLAGASETPALPPAPEGAVEPAAEPEPPKPEDKTPDPEADLFSWGGDGAAAGAGAGAGAAAAGAAGKKEEKPEEPAGETVDCYKCGGPVPITSTKRPLLISCPGCGTKGMLEE